MRRILYVSGTRADFGLMRSSLQRIAADPDLDLGVLVTGMHLDPAYGETWREIEDSGHRIAGRVPVPLAPATGETMARAIGRMIVEFVDVMLRDRPDIVLLLGDRGEMLAGATAGLHLNIPVAHIHGGERSGTIDESVRHAVSKLSHIHFTATREARERLIRLGEVPENVHVIGAPGVDGLTAMPVRRRDEVIRELGLDIARPMALVVFHPVLQEASEAENKTRAVLDGLRRAGWQSVAIMPNADAGSARIRAVFEDEAPQDMKRFVHLPRDAFVEIMAVADAMVGNSSAGIIEAASFGTPVLNLGSRQRLRERNANVMDLPEDAQAIADALAAIRQTPRPPATNIYGDGHTAERLVDLLKSQPLDGELMNKVLRY